MFRTLDDIKVTMFRQSHESSILYPPKKRGDLGMDLSVPTTVVGKVIYPFVKYKIDTLLSIQARGAHGEMYGFVVEPRSSNWSDALFSCGVIDAEYTGTIKIIIRNLSLKPYKIKHGDRLCQLLLQPCCNIHTEFTEKPLIGIRGDAGYGSTNK